IGRADRASSSASRATSSSALLTTKLNGATTSRSATSPASRNGATSRPPRGKAATVSAARPRTQTHRPAWNPIRRTTEAVISALRVLGIRPDDVPHQPVPDHVRLLEVTEADPLDPGQDALDLQQPRVLAV